MILPLFFHSNLGAASRILFPHFTITGPEGIRQVTSSPDFQIFTDAEGSGGCAVRSSSFSVNFKEAFLLVAKGGEVDQAPVKGANLIFVLELFAVVSAAWPLELGAHVCW